jgi:glutaminyl-peptide cyclotransferase
MAKTRKKSQPFSGPATDRKVVTSNTIAMDGKRPVNWSLIALFLLISVGGTYLAIALRPGSGVPRYTYEVRRTFDHDPNAFTQGLVVHDGFLWESTGLNGQSSIRKIDLETGEVLIQKDLDEKYFAEGLTVLDGKLYQLTWKAGVGFIYDLELNKIGEFKYEGQGWGLTNDGKQLILSDGTPEIKFLDPETFEVVRTIWVRRKSARVGRLNELEMFGLKPKLYANRFNSDLIYEIDPGTGEVTAEIDLAGLWPKRERPEGGVLNGIAIHPKSKKMLVTGKLCPKIFEVQLFPVED